jgi:CheY-like chemotaxis protein
VVQRFTLRSLDRPDARRTPTTREATILLVEDNLADAGLVREALEEHGVRGELLIITDGDRAVRYLTSLGSHPECPDLIIVDLNLPKMSGLEILERMGKTENCSHITTVVLSSSDAQEDRNEALRLGARRYLPKPLRLDEFLALGEVFRELIEAAK